MHDSSVCIKINDSKLIDTTLAQTPFDHIRAMVWSGARGNIARTAL